jgi:Golgi nucleoside diphosphatase
MKKIVPHELWAETPLWLKATAGMRMLPQDKSDAVYANVRKFLMDKEHCPFLFDPSWAKTIPGNDEGAFGWISFNYLMKLVGPKRAPGATSPYAVVEMGGASAQVEKHQQHSAIIFISSIRDM